MRNDTIIAIVASLVLTVVPAMALEVGEDAPAFSLPGSDGETHSLADFRGERAVVIAWFPKAFTGG
jgi:peroxiredoxin Q/BCP